MELASACIDRRVIKFGRVQDELVEWRNKRLGSKTFCTLPNTDAIDFDTLYHKLCYKINLLPSILNVYKCGFNVIVFFGFMNILVFIYKYEIII
jgi:hypothetical protein